MKTFVIATICSLGLYAIAPTLQAAEGQTDGTATNQARITEAVARAAASTRFPNSAFESSDLEKEKGRWIWSIHLRPHGSNDVQEVQVDALTGKIFTTEVETSRRDEDPRRRR